MLQLIKNKISSRFAFNAFLTIFLIGLSYHFLILAQIVDYRFAWGGQLRSVSQMYQFETIAVLLQFLFLGTVWVKTKKNGKFLKYLLFGIAFLFLLNTIGNIFAKQLVEAVLFTPLTFLSAIFVFRLAIE